MQTCSGSQLAESWGSLTGLLKDGMTLTPPAQFFMLAILNEFVQKCPPLAEKKDMKDLQDVTAKVCRKCIFIHLVTLAFAVFISIVLAVTYFLQQTCVNKENMYCHMWLIFIL
jgi:hypothetical protein